MSDLDEDLLALAGADESEEEDQVLTTTSAKRAKNNDQSLSKKRRIEVGSVEDDDEEDDYNPYSVGNADYGSEEEEEANLFPWKESTRMRATESTWNPYLKWNVRLYYLKDLKSCRSTRRGNFLEARGRDMKEQQQRAKNDEDSRKTRASTRSTHATGHSDIKASKLSQLKKQRARKNRHYSDNEDEDDEEDYREEDYKDDEGSEYGDDEEYNPFDRRDTYDKREEVEWAEEEDEQDREPEISDFNKLRIGRSFVAKFCFYPGFEDAVKGCYGRVNVGTDKRTGKTSYRMVRIERVFLQKPYNMGKFYTNQYFGVTQGKDRKVFQMNYFM